MRLWSMESRVAHGEPLEGHTGSVTSVPFLPDAKRIVLGSDAVSTNTSPIVKWHLHSGWVLSDSNDLLLWLPTPNREGLWTPGTELIIGRRQTMVSFQNSVHGSEWKNCYIGL
ncbi:hypothetical protein B0H11DRAFT_1954756 [Mycena galericulata]|nr:hypothetical protein B0H11DRAFT_1954756 [Mycena galericulata]